MTIPTLHSLKLPEVFQKIACETSGLVLVTGAKSSGKSTTLAALLNEINEHREVSVVTLESNLAFRHAPRKATFKYLEKDKDFATYEQGLLMVANQPPGVILVEEIRDRETAVAAFRAAEAGHLVLGSLFTIDAGYSVLRICGMFSDEERAGARICLAHALRWVINQRIAPGIDGGSRQALFEIMGTSDRVKESMELGEKEGQTFYEIIEACRTHGWQTFDQAAVDAYERGLISDETAVLYCTKKWAVSRRIEAIKRRRGGSI